MILKIDFALVFQVSSIFHCSNFQVSFLFPRQRLKYVFYKATVLKTFQFLEIQILRNVFQRSIETNVLIHKNKGLPQMNKQMGKHVQVKLQLLIYLSIHNQSVFVKIMTRLNPVNRRKCSSMTEDFPLP